MEDTFLTVLGFRKPGTLDNTHRHLFASYGAHLFTTSTLGRLNLLVNSPYRENSVCSTVHRQTLTQDHSSSTAPAGVSRPCHSTVFTQNVFFLIEGKTTLTNNLYVTHTSIKLGLPPENYELKSQTTVAGNLQPTRNFCVHLSFRTLFSNEHLDVGPRTTFPRTVCAADVLTFCTFPGVNLYARIFVPTC